AGAVGPAGGWTGDGTCPAAPGARGRAWSAAFDITPGGSSGGGSGSSTQPCASAQGAACEDTARPCAEPWQDHGSPCTPSHAPVPTPAPVEHGVRAGSGGSFSDSVPALVAGGLLIAGALGAAGHRLWRRRSAPAA
ncbi:hypothetical protein ACWD25_62175, partial [Streptomyces sp. NPDC002920]